MSLMRFWGFISLRLASIVLWIAGFTQVDPIRDGINGISNLSFPVIQKAREDFVIG